MIILPNQASEPMPNMCDNCVLQFLCDPQAGFSAEQLQDLEQVIQPSRTIKKGQFLFCADDHFESLFAVRAGFFKTSLHEDVLKHDAPPRVTGFFMPGELLGLDSLDGGVYRCDAMALEDSEVCELPLAQLEEISQKIPSVAMQFYKIMSRQIACSQKRAILNSMRADERLALFLLNLSRRFALRGFSATHLQLRMSREDLASYLGLKLETVSRTFSRFQSEGWLSIEHRRIELLQPEALQAMVENVKRTA